MPPKKTQDGWNEYEKLVMSKLDSHDKNFSEVLKQLQSHSEHLSDFKLEVAKAMDTHKTSCEIAKEFPKFSRDIEGIKSSLHNIAKSEKEISDNTKDVGTLKVEVARLQVKSGIWGAVGGVVSLATIILAVALEDKFPALVKFFIGK